MLNDTLPHPRSWYMFISTKIRKVLCISGLEMLSMGTDALFTYYHDILELRTINRCGAFKMCARPNLSFDISDIINALPTPKITLKAKPKNTFKPKPKITLKVKPINLHRPSQDQVVPGHLEGFHEIHSS